MPKLDMTDSETILSWYRVRRIFLNFGSYFTNRMFLYCGILLTLNILGLIGLLIYLFIESSISLDLLFAPLSFVSMITLSIFVILSV